MEKEQHEILTDEEASDLSQIMKPRSPIQVLELSERDIVSHKIDTYHGKTSYMGRLESMR